MRRAFRISKRRHAATAFSGEGAKLAGGRWNSPGRAVVYLSSTLSLAALAVFVHLAEDAAILDFVYFEVTIPDGLTVTQAHRRPRGWDAEPPSITSMAIGDRWLRDSEQALLEVPSIIIPTETNLLLHPLHRDVRKLVVSSPKPFRFDTRMRKG